MGDEYQLRKDIDTLKNEVIGIKKSQLDTEEITTIIENNTINNYITNNNVDNLLDVIVDYNQMSDDEYYLFRGDCWTINSNFESSAAVISNANNHLKVLGTFRTTNDLVGLYWNSTDIIGHNYISYGTRTDYTDVTLDFDYTMSGCKNFSAASLVITIAKTDGSIYYLPTASFVNNNHFSMDFNTLELHDGDVYHDKNHQPVEVTETTPLAPTDIEYIMFMIAPSTYDGGAYVITANVDFSCEISNIVVTNGFICNEHLALEPHQYRLCEGYDDIYNLNPRRLAREMRKLGYVQWLDLYIGASHYYDKTGTIGDTITSLDFNHERTEKMTLKRDVPLNRAFSAWLDCYARELKANGTDKLIISVSMENLQCTASWRQKTAAGDYAETAWIPSTFFYSPCNPNVIIYMKSVSQACLDIVVANGMQPILQMGEAWWWWNVNDIPIDPVTHEPVCTHCYQAPCFYDDNTKNAYYSEFLENIPEYSSSWETSYSHEMMSWLNQKLVDYVDEIGTVVKSSRYTNGVYMALFFPPSVIDVDEVPAMIREVNFIKDSYSPHKLDILQLEDYDWVINESPHHDEVYNLGQELEFTLDKIHYFGGFVQYEKDAIPYWKLIKNAMETAINKDFAEVFVWAGSQVRRDNKIIGHDSFEAVQYLLTHIQQNIYNETTILGESSEEEEEGESSESITDSGWIVLTKQSIFWNYDSAYRVRYRKYGNIVQVQGLTQLSETQQSTSDLVIGQLPADYRPSNNMMFLQEMYNNSDVWTCKLNTYGELSLSRIRNSNGAVIPNNNHVLNINITFLV